MTATVHRIVHEAEAQRQHMRLKLPARVHVAGAVFDAYDWGSGGVALPVPEGRFPPALKEASFHTAELAFDFEGFRFNVPCTLEVRYVEKKMRRIGCRFHLPDRQLLSLLHYLVGAAVSGEVVAAGDLLHVAGRNNFTRERKLPPREDTARRRWSRRARFLGLGIAFALLAAWVSASLYERMFVITAPAARVTAETVTLAAPADGKLFYRPGASVKKGEAALNLITDKGTALDIVSPCDCSVRYLAESNADVRKGEKLAELVPQGAAPYIEASLPAADAVRLAEEGHALFLLPGKDAYAEGKIISIRAAGEGRATLTITPQERLEERAVGFPAEVRFDTRDLF